LEAAVKIEKSLKVFMTFDSASDDAGFEQFEAIFNGQIGKIAQKSDEKCDANSDEKSNEKDAETKNVKPEIENQSNSTDTGKISKWIRTVYDEYIRSCQIARDRQHHSQLDKICLSAGIQDSRKVEYDSLVKDSEKEPEKEKSLKASIGSVEISEQTDETNEMGNDDEVSLHSSEDRSDDEMSGVGMSDDDGDSVFSVGLGRAKNNDSTTDMKRKTTSDCRSDDKSDSKTVNKSENVTVSNTGKTDVKTDTKTDTQKSKLDRTDTFHSCQETINLTLLSSDDETEPSPAKKIKMDEPAINEVSGGLKIDSDSDEFENSFEKSVGNNSKNVKQAQHDEIICLDSD